MKKKAVPARRLDYLKPYGISRLAQSRVLPRRFEVERHLSRDGEGNDGKPRDARRPGKIEPPVKRQFHLANAIGRQNAKNRVARNHPQHRCRGVNREAMTFT